MCQLKTKKEVVINLIMASTIYAWCVCLLCIYTLTAAQYFDIYCDTHVSNFVESTETHVYQLFINDTYNVNIDSCYSYDDIIIGVSKETLDVLVDSSCLLGDNCGVCSNDDYFAENFTLTLDPGIYSIQIASQYAWADLGANYTLDIRCHPTDHNTTAITPFAYNTTSTTMDIITTRTYTTSVAPNFTETDDCHYYSDDTFATFRSHLIMDSMIIQNGTVDITFYIKLNSYCLASLCNIFYILDPDEFIEVLSFSMHGYNGYFEIVSATDNWGITESHQIPYADYLLPLDGNYHSIHLVHAFTLNSFDSWVNQNYIEIDGVNGYYDYYPTMYSLSTSHNNRYEFYISSPYEYPINASISNICVRTGSYLLTDLNDMQEIECGGVLDGEFYTAYDEDYIFINTSTDYSVLFNASLSSFDAFLVLGGYPGPYMGADYNTLYFKTLYAGSYMLTIMSSASATGFGAWSLEVTCDDQIDNDTMYKVIESTWSWNQAQRECEISYGTSLATIVTDEDLTVAIQNIKDQSEQIGHNYTHSVGRNVRLGMYKNVANGSKWQWVSGQTCNYTASGDCMDAVHWNAHQPDSLPASIFGTDDEYKRQYGAILHINWTTKSAEFYDVPFMYEAAVWTEDSSLCNAPGSKYFIENCNGMINCWKSKSNCCNDNNLLNDTTFNGLDQYEFHPPIVYWNSKLFIVGLQYIHYTNITLLEDIYEWHHAKYNHDNLKTHKVAQRYAQYRSSVYMYVFDASLSDVIYHIDLDTMDINLIYLPSIYPSVWYNNGNEFIVLRYCMVATGAYLYVLRYRMILIYNLQYDTWSAEPFIDGNPVSCAITNDHKYIYAFTHSYESDFGGFIRSFIVKYDTDSTIYETLDTVNICSFYRSYDETDAAADFFKAITGRDNKIYLHGCYTGSWKTVIFNPETDKFETETIDISHPNLFSVPYYRASQLTVFDDNVLLLLHKTYAQYPKDIRVPSKDFIALYYAITYRISINFTLTMTENATFPSDALWIQYYVNNFDDIYTTYRVLLQSINTMHLIHAVIILNISTDDCICNEIEYNCYNCSHYFNLREHLTVVDNNVDVLQLNATLIDHNHFLILPKIIAIKLQRCKIFFDDLNETTSSNNPFIYFTFNLSELCFTEKGKMYSLNIQAIKISISHELNITIVNNHTYLCIVCSVYNNSECMACDQGTFIIEHTTSGLKSRIVYNISIQSKMIDFSVIAPGNQEMQYFLDGENRVDTQMIRDYLYLLFLLIIPLVVIYIVYVVWNKSYMNAFIVDNALVLIIGISQFEDVTQFLKGVPQNVEYLTELWRNTYNYDTFICNERTLKSSKKDIMQFMDEHLCKLEERKYKSVIVHIISHGLEKCFFSSNEEQIDIDFIQHEIVTKATETKQLKLIKLIFHHGCQGYADHAIGTNTDEDDMHMAVNRVAFKVNSEINHNVQNKITYDSNYLLISGNIAGRAMSDSGNFTRCICQSFGDNLEKCVKADLNTLLIQIGQMLEEKTRHAELCNVNGTIRFNQIRLEQCKEIRNNSGDHNHVNQ
eukprot:44612_1